MHTMKKKKDEPVHFRVEHGCHIGWRRVSGIKGARRNTVSGFRLQGMPAFELLVIRFRKRQQVRCAL